MRHRITRLATVIALAVGLAGVGVGVGVGGGTSAAAAETGAEAAQLGITQIDAGLGHTCARLSNGEARCWGHNTFRQVGNNSIGNAPLPVPVLTPAGTGPLTGVAQVSAGAYHSCARLANGQARCWGYNGLGQLGVGDQGVHPLPMIVKAVGGTGRLRDVRQIVAGFDHTCARVAGGQVRCWGDNTQGQIGDASNSPRPTPVAVLNPTGGPGPLTGVTQISAGSTFTCARLNTGRVACWGNNSNDQLGIGSPGDRNRPVFVSNPSGSGPLTGVASVTTGDFSSCVRLTNGQARCWGNGFLGNSVSSQEDRPVAVLNAGGSGPLTGVTQIAAGGNHTCARITNGRLRCWGANDQSQIGDRSTANRGRPVWVVNPVGTDPLTGVLAVTAGGKHTCARLNTGITLCGGDNGSGQLGDGTFADRDRPIGVRR